jgi:hypothetical protein
VRTQSAEEVMRTIVVNGKTAPARIAQLSAVRELRVGRATPGGPRIARSCPG